MPTSGPKSQRKKPPAVPAAEPQKEKERDQTAEGFADTDGFSGQGAESALARLRELEKNRKPGKGGR